MTWSYQLYNLELENNRYIGCDLGCMFEEKQHKSTYELTILVSENRYIFIETYIESM